MVKLLKEDLLKDDPSTKAIKLISALVEDEWEAITGYTDAITKLRALHLDNQDEIEEEISDIVGEENMHVGQLQKLIDQIDPFFAEKQEAGLNHGEHEEE